MNKIIKDTMAITVITFVAGLSLGFVNDITREPIAKQEALAKQEAYQAVFEEADSFEVLFSEEKPELESYLDEQGYPLQSVEEGVLAKTESGEALGYAFTVNTSEGYGGDIRFTMGIRLDGTTEGLSILSIAETAGLGMKATTREFQSQFEGKQVEAFTYTKSGAVQEDEIDALSGATITTNAMTNGVNAGLCAFRFEKGGTQ